MRLRGSLLLLALLLAAPLTEAGAQVRRKRYTLTGMVVSAGSGRSTVQRTAGSITKPVVQVLCAPTTVYEQDGKPVPAGAVTAGKRIQVEGTQFDGITLTASKIRIIIPKPDPDEPEAAPKEGAKGKKDRPRDKDDPDSRPETERNAEKDDPGAGRDEPRERDRR